MKKVIGLCSLALLMLLSGCKDARTGLSNGNEALITVGNHSITKNDVYDGLKNKNGTTAVISKVTNFLVDKEVPVTDAMREEAKETLKKFKETLGADPFNQYLSSMNMTEENYLEEKVLPTVRAQYLTTAYIDSNYDEIKKDYEIRKVQIFQTSDSKVAVEVQEKVKNGELTIEEAVEKYKGVTTTYTGKDQIVTNKSKLSKDTWSNILAVTENDTLLDVYQYSSDLTAFYVIKVIETDVSLEDAKSSLEAITSIGDDAFAFYLKKYNFRVYDIDLYNGIKSQNESYLVQD